MQIAHLQQDKNLAKITWHAQRPFNLTNYQYNKAPYNIPFRIFNKLEREVKTLLGRPYIQRNWELQFLGDKNEKQLKQYLFDTEFNNWIPEKLISDCYHDFTHLDSVGSSHAISMLLTLSVWYRTLNEMAN